MEVTSQVGQGSTFKVFLPSSSATPLVLSDAEESSAPEPGRGETILFVEDEIAVRELACVALRKRGYHVLNAANGPEAIEVWNQSLELIDLLVTDVVLPGVGGRQLAELLRERHAEMKVLYLSGYTGEAVVRNGILEEQAPFLQKPFTPAALAHKVREVLQG